MSDKLSKLNETPIKIDLLHFYDEFVELHDCYSFMCEAFAGLITEGNSIDEEAAMGANQFCLWIKQRMQKLKENLKQIHKKAYTLTE